MKQGSISVFLTILLPGVLIVALILGEYSLIRFERVRARADQYLALDQGLSAFRRDLFTEMGLLAVEIKAEGSYLDPLSERDILESSVLLLMRDRFLLTGLHRAEEVVSDFLKKKVGVEFALFDIHQLNDELDRLTQELLHGKEVTVKVEAFLLRMLVMKPYVELRGIGWNALIEDLKAFRLEEIQARKPYFVIRESIRTSYDLLMKAIRRFDGLGLLEKYQLADYGVDYLGYSMTKEEKETLHTEYLLTGFSEKPAQRDWVRMELFGLRLLLNLSEVLINPELRDRVLSLSAHQPGLFFLEALVLSTAEAWRDVAAILDRKKVPFYKGHQSFQVMGGGPYTGGWVYPDYLRVLLMLVPRDLYFHRLRKAIEHNYDLDLSHCYTAMRLSWRWEAKGRSLPVTFSETMEGELSYVKTRLLEP